MTGADIILVRLADGLEQQPAFVRADGERAVQLAHEHFHRLVQLPRGEKGDAAHGQRHQRHDHFQTQQQLIALGDDVAFLVDGQILQRGNHVRAPAHHDAQLRNIAHIVALGNRLDGNIHLLRRVGHGLIAQQQQRARVGDGEVRFRRLLERRAVHRHDEAADCAAVAAVDGLHERQRRRAILLQAVALLFKRHPLQREMMDSAHHALKILNISLIAIIEIDIQPRHAGRCDQIVLIIKVDIGVFGIAHAAQEGVQPRNGLALRLIADAQIGLGLPDEPLQIVAVAQREQKGGRVFPEPVDLLRAAGHGRPEHVHMRLHGNIVLVHDHDKAEGRHNQHAGQKRDQRTKKNPSSHRRLARHVFLPLPPRPLQADGSFFVTVTLYTIFASAAYGFLTLTSNFLLFRHWSAILRKVVQKPA